MIKLSADWIVALGLIKKKGLKTLVGGVDATMTTMTTQLLLTCYYYRLYCFSTAFTYFIRARA